MRQAMVLIPVKLPRSVTLTVYMNYMNGSETV